MHWLYELYKNIFALLKYRKYADPDNMYTEKQFMSQIDLNKFIKVSSSGIINNNNKLRVPIDIILLHDESTYLSKKEYFDKLLKNVSIPSDKPHEILIFSESPVNNTVANSINLLISKNDKLLFRVVHPCKIMVDMSKINSAHKVLTDEEYDAEQGVYNIPKYNLPKIKINDTMVIWTGARVDDVIKVTTICSNVANSTTYKIVIT